MARAKRNEEQMGLFEVAINDRRYGNGGRPVTAPTNGAREQISRCARNDGGGRAMAAPTETGGRISRSARNDSLWQVKKRGNVGVSSHAPNCGYDEGTVKSLQERGWHLYKDGEKVW